MDREVLFAKALETVTKTARQQGNCISREQIEAEFKELMLEKEQMALVEEYLAGHRIGIGEPLDQDDYLTKEEINYLEHYMESLALLEEVSEGEKEAFTLSAMAGDRQAQERLLAIYLPDVVEIAKLYGGQGVFLEDLIGEGNLALTTGVTMLGCLEHAEEAQGMLGKLVMDAMEDFISDNLEEDRKDKKVLKKVNEVADKAAELAEALHRKVTIAELMEETGLSEKAIREAIRISGDNMENIENNGQGMGQ